MKRTGGQILVDQLIIHGADLAFCVPGESYLPVLDALYGARERIELITCRHESGAANMAEAYGKLTGTPGLCFVTRGPGATNASIGVHTAFQDSTPMILFIGQVGSDFIEREAFQEIDYRRMLRRSTARIAFPSSSSAHTRWRRAGEWGQSCSHCPRTCCSQARRSRTRVAGSVSSPRRRKRRWSSWAECCGPRNVRS
jgi:hypothetical protein